MQIYINICFNRKQVNGVMQAIPNHRPDEHSTGWHKKIHLFSITRRVRIQPMPSFIFLHFYCIIFSHLSSKHDWKTVLTFIQSAHQMGDYLTRNVNARYMYHRMHQLNRVCIVCSH